MSIAKHGADGVVSNLLKSFQCHAWKDTSSVSAPAIAENVDFPHGFSARRVGSQKLAVKVVLSTIRPCYGELVSYQLDMSGNFHLETLENLSFEPKFAAIDSSKGIKATSRTRWIGGLVASLIVGVECFVGIGASLIVGRL